MTTITLKPTGVVTSRDREIASATVTHLSRAGDTLQALKDGAELPFGPTMKSALADTTHSIVMLEGLADRTPDRASAPLSDAKLAQELMISIATPMPNAMRDINGMLGQSVTLLGRSVGGVRAGYGVS